MIIDFWTIVLAGLVASIVWFIIGGVFYMNPWVAKIYKNAESYPALKKWANTPKYIFLQFVGILLQTLLWAFVFAFIKPVLSDVAITAGLTFALIIFVMKIIPRAYDMWIQTNYPNQLLIIEFINGTIGGLVIGITFAYMI